MVWEFQNWEMQKWFINYSFTQGKKYEAWKFDGEWRLINWKRVQRDWTIEEWEFENRELSGWKRVYPGWENGNCICKIKFSQKIKHINSWS